MNRDFFFAALTLFLLNLSMALQPFVGPSPLFSFLALYTVGKTHWTGDQPVARPHRDQHKHPCIEWDSNP
jgi:hypothetical protein